MDSEITEFINVSGTDRRIAQFFLERQHNNVNDALEDYFSHPDIEIPESYLREETNNDNDSNDSYSYTNSYESANQNTNNNNNHVNTMNSIFNSFLHHDSDKSNQEPTIPPVNSPDISIKEAFPIFEFDSSAIITSKIADISEQEENDFNNDIEPFPKQISKGKSAKIFVYSNGVLLLDNFFDKSNSDEYSQIIKSLQCGFLPSDLVPNNIVDIEISDLRTQKYVK